MRHEILKTLVATCIAIWPLGAHAAVTEDTFQLRSTSDLVELCSAAPQDRLGTAALNFCEGFGIGVFRVLQEVEATGKLRMFCLPDPMPTRNGALAAFVTWGKANADKLGLPAQDGFAAFLNSQYPCARRK